MATSSLLRLLACVGVASVLLLATSNASTSFERVSNSIVSATFTCLTTRRYVTCIPTAPAVGRTFTESVSVSSTAFAPANSSATRASTLTTTASVSA